MFEKCAKSGRTGGRGVGGWVGGQFGLGLSCCPCFSRECRFFAEGYGFFVPKWVWISISQVWEKFQTRSSLFSQDRAFLLGQLEKQGTRNGTGMEWERKTGVGNGNRNRNGTGMGMGNSSRCYYYTLYYGSATFVPRNVMGQSHLLDS